MLVLSRHGNRLAGVLGLERDHGAIVVVVGMYHIAASPAALAK